jgi:nucleotide-binding universal stress UspA family protein
MTIAKKILVATDFSELGQAAVTQASNLAHALGSTLDVVHVFTLQNMTEAAAMTRDQLEDAERRARVHLDAVAAAVRATGRLGQAVLRHGDPAPMILLAATELDSELIVLGTHGRKGMSRFVMGSTAESVLRQARVPVLVVKVAHAVRSSIDAASLPG